MAQAIEWCIMNYITVFYVSILVFLFQSIAGYTTMMEQSFRVVVILGLLAILSLSYKNK